MSILGVNMNILGDNMYNLGANMYISVANMYILGTTKVPICRLWIQKVQPQ